jgi:serine/threonine protein kinase
MVATVKSIGKFQVVGTLGTGAHSTILRIRRNADSKQYALKVVPIEGPDDQKYLDQAQHEFRVAQMLDHPDLLKIYALETTRDWLLRPRKIQLLIEYVNGRTLDTVPPMPLCVLVQVFVHIAAGLVHMHRRGVCHADVKPNNIMLSRTGDVRIIDFGLARIRDKNPRRLQGTPEYMAPEQAKHGHVTERTDIYNFGATMYRLLTWRLPPPPTAELNDMRMDRQTRKLLFKPVQEFNAEAPSVLCDLVHSCLEHEPTKRPERMSEIFGVLDRLADELLGKDGERLEDWEW